MEPKVMAPKAVEPKIKTRLNAESYKIRKRLSFDNFYNIVVLEKIKKVTYFFKFKFLIKIFILKDILDIICLNL